MNNCVFVETKNMKKANLCIVDKIRTCLLERERRREGEREKDTSYWQCYKWMILESVIVVNTSLISTTKYNIKKHIIINKIYIIV